ncbi:MAG TPA: hypothetical protein VKF62_00555, partial [Planctomycetota bacterium]|nr:hypothetical protein [Planctomycetota bacterium]
AVAALTTVVFRDVYIPPSRFGFRFVGLVQKVSDPLAAAESVWRISIDGRVVETVTGIASAATTPAPIFVHGRGPSRVDVSVQNVDALMAFDASPLLIGYRYPLPYDTPGLQGTSVE